MSSFKDRLPTTEALHTEIAAGWDTLMAEINAKAGPLEADYILQKKFSAVATVFIVLGIGLPLLAINLSDEIQVPLWLWLLALLAAVIGFPLGIWLNRKAKKYANEFQSVLNSVIFSYVISVLALDNGAHFQSSLTKAVASSRESLLKMLSSLRIAENKQVIDLLDHSELVTEPRNQVSVDDMITATVNGQPLFISELDLKHVTGSGKNRSVKKIFHGYFVSYDLTKNLTGKTFISSEGDTKGFGHRSFWSSLKGHDAAVTELEWNDFENLLHVAATDPTEARYVLTTNFMQDLYDWWHSKKQNIRISFIQNRMYLLFPDDKIKLNATVSKIDETELQAYVKSISEPLLHVLHLVEDVRL